MTPLHHQNLQQHTTEIQVLVFSTASNYWRRDQAAFDNMVLSSSAESRLSWRRDGTISLSRLASDITAPIFPIITCFIQSQKCSCIFKVLWVEMSSMLSISLCRSSETSLEGNNNGLRLRHQWHEFKYMEMCWCRHHWEWQHPGILIWDLICKFQSTVVVITDFLCREIYIFNFHMHVSISDHLNLLLYSSWNLYRIQEYEKIDGFCFLWLSLQKGHFF